MIRRLRATFSRLLVTALVVMVAVGAAMPAWARLAGGPPEHACKCEVRGGHAHCACPLCFPELGDDDLVTGLASAKGKCGDDDPGWRTLACAGVPVSSFVVAPPLGRIEPEAAPPDALSHAVAPPEPPPPRRALST